MLPGWEARRRGDRMTRRLPAPWHADKFSGGYVVRDANGFAVAYVYGRSTEAEAMEAKQMTMDEARRVASNIATLPDTLKRGERAVPLKLRATVAAGAFCRRLCARRRWRSRHAPDGSTAVRAARATVRRREPGRRLQQSRHRAGGARARRRIHAHPAQ